MEGQVGSLWAMHLGLFLVPGWLEEACIEVLDGSA